VFYFGFVHAGLLIAQIVVSKNFGFWERIFGRLSFAKASAWLTMIGFGTVALWPNPVTIGIFIALSGGFGLSRLAYFSSHFNRHIPSAQRATILSLISMLRRVTLMILNPIIGLLALHSLSWALFLLTVIPVISLSIRYQRKEQLASTIG
jgi:hypothetical protein